jgi:hypothetical protein
MRMMARVKFLGLLGVVLAAPNCETATAAEASLEVATSADGGSIRQGATLTITWRASGTPAGSSVTLELQKAVTRRLFPPLAAGLATQGAMSWKVPVFVVRPIMCARDATGGCVNDINPGTTYRIVATLQAPYQGEIAVPVRASSGTFAMLEAGEAR